tara:strand:+ start:97 stop:366 length:270 start_codon:yes stop_codon:yes gene_type:complete
MPTDREREYYAMGFSDGFKAGKSKAEVQSLGRSMGIGSIRSSKPKRKLSAWNKFVKANSKKKIYRFANGKLKLKKMGIAFRKTPAGRKR